MSEIMCLVPEILSLITTEWPLTSLTVMIFPLIQTETWSVLKLTSLPTKIGLEPDELVLDEGSDSGVVMPLVLVPLVSTELVAMSASVLVITVWIISLVGWDKRVGVTTPLLRLVSVVSQASHELDPGSGSLELTVSMTFSFRFHEETNEG